jgi:hypothetical protein
MLERQKYHRHQLPRQHCGNEHMHNDRELSETLEPPREQWPGNAGASIVWAAYSVAV